MRRSRRRKRATGFRDQIRVVRVYAEGKVTEPAYLRCMMPMSRTVRLDVADSGGSAPMTLVRAAREAVKANRRGDDFDEIWCVFDCDEHPHVAQAIREARDKGIKTAFSNPCFELWLVLHIEDWNAPANRKEVQVRSGELGLTDGKALANGAEAKLVEGYDEAKRRAQALDGHHEGQAPPRANPSTNVWQLVDSLRALSVD